MMDVVSWEWAATAPNVSYDWMYAKIAEAYSLDKTSRTG
jgi:cobalamin biosynthesis Mg chelatase CobN